MFVLHFYLLSQPKLCDPELYHLLILIANIYSYLHMSNISFKFLPLLAGNYFGAHFIMGGERFDTPQPEAYLFGENSDLNFLGSRPTAVIISLILH